VRLLLASERVAEYPLAFGRPLRAPAKGERTIRQARPRSGSARAPEQAPVGLARVTLVLLLLAGAAAGCRPREPEVGDGDATVHETKVELEPCDGDSAERYDADDDGNPEVVIYKQGVRPICKRLDFDDDGRPDRTTFFDRQGRVRRVESDFDRDLRIDEIAIYEAGVIQEKWRATVLRGQLDTWEYYEGGVRVRSERDADGDGVVDQWWDYARRDCPLIHSDVNGDGLADPGSTIDYCKEVGEGGFREGDAARPKKAGAS